jgi:uncharacterized FlaG/YvyC family protein
LVIILEYFVNRYNHQGQWKEAKKKSTTMKKESGKTSMMKKEMGRKEEDEEHEEEEEEGESEVAEVSEAKDLVGVEVQFSDDLEYDNGIGESLFDGDNITSPNIPSNLFVN